MNDITTGNELSERISAAALEIEDKVIAWRRDIHENPELSYRGDAPPRSPPST